MSHVVTVPELLDGHTVLDIECLDRIYLNGYVPKLQVGGQVVTFLHDHRGMPIASPAVSGQIGARFRQAVGRFAEMNDIPMVKFKKGMRKIDVMRPLLERAARAGRPGVVAIGWAQEFQLVWDARKRDTDPSRPPQFSFAKAERRVTCYYFYVWDESWGPYADRSVMPHLMTLCWPERLPSIRRGILLVLPLPGHSASRKARRLSGGVYRPSRELPGASRESACSLSFMSACR